MHQKELKYSKLMEDLKRRSWKGRLKPEISFRQRMNYLCHIRSAVKL